MGDLVIVQSVMRELGKELEDRALGPRQYIETLEMLRDTLSLMIESKEAEIEEKVMLELAAQAQADQQDEPDEDEILEPDKDETEHWDTPGGY